MSYDLLFFRLKKGTRIEEALRIFGGEAALPPAEEPDEDEDDDEDEDEPGKDESDGLPFDLKLRETQIVEQMSVPFITALLPPEHRSEELQQWLKAAESNPKILQEIEDLPLDLAMNMEFEPISTGGVYVLDVDSEDLGHSLKAVCAALGPLASKGIYVLDPQLGVLMPEDPADEYFDIDESADDGIEDDE